jgi:hypothetical protein
MTHRRGPGGQVYLVDSVRQKMEDRSVTAYLVPLVFPNERRVEGAFCLDEGHHTLTLGYRGGRLQVVIDEDYFEAFCRIREKLEADGIRPFCYGANRNVYPSGMSRDMGGGLMAYKLTLGQPSRSADLVNIFIVGLDVEPVSVSEQREFYLSWVASLSKGA